MKSAFKIGFNLFPWVALAVIGGWWVTHRTRAPVAPLVYPVKLRPKPGSRVAAHPKTPAAGAGDTKSFDDMVGQLKTQFADTSGSSDRSDQIDDAIEKMVGLYPEATMEWLADGNVEGQARVDAIQTGVEKWAADDPAAAAAWVANLGAHDNSWEQAVDALVGPWGAKDGAAAADWIAANVPVPDVRSDAYETLFSSWADSDPSAATQAALYYTQTNKDVSSDVVTGALDSWIEKDLAGARSFVESLPAGDLRNDAVNTLVTDWAATDPAGAVSYANNIQDTQQRVDALQNAFGAWADVSPSAAVAALGQFTGEDALQISAARQIMDKWVSSDAVAASQWMDNLPEGPAKDAVIEEFTSGLMSDDPNSAMNWVLNVGDPSLRDSQLESLGTEWMNTDMPQAIDWLNSNNVPQKIKDEILSNTLNDSATDSIDNPDAQ